MVEKVNPGTLNTEDQSNSIDISQASKSQHQEFPLYTSGLYRIRHDYDTTRFQSGRANRWREPQERGTFFPWVRRFGLPVVPEQHPASVKVFFNPDNIKKARWFWCSENGTMEYPEWRNWYVNQNYDPTKNKLPWAVHENAQMYNGNPYPNIPDEHFGDGSGVPNGMELLGNGGNIVFVDKVLGEWWGRIRTGKSHEAETYPNYFDDPIAVHAVANIIQENRDCPVCNSLLFVDKSEKPVFYEYCKKCGYRERTWMIMPNPKGTVQHPWVYDNDLFFRLDWLEPFPEIPRSVMTVRDTPILPSPSIYSNNVIRTAFSGETFVINGYYARGSDVYGKTNGGEVIPLQIAPFRNGSGKLLPEYFTDWKMKTLPPSLEEVAKYK